MPVELQLHHYVFTPKWSSDPPSPGSRKRARTQVNTSSRTSAENLSSSDNSDIFDSETFWDLTVDLPVSLPEVPEFAITRVPIRYNPRHDLEALWWVSLSFVFLRTVSVSRSAGDPAEIERLRRQKGSAWTLFRQRDERQDVLAKAGFLAGHLKNLHPIICEAARPLELARTLITGSYKKLEKDFTEEKEFDVPRSLYNSLRKAWHMVSELLRALDIQLEPLDIEA